MRAYLRDIFEEAVDQDFLSKDPAARLRLPTQHRETDKTTLTWDQLRSALESVRAEDRILLELEMTDALRPGELFALRWKCFDPDASSLRLPTTTDVYMQVIPEGVSQMIDSMHDELREPSAIEHQSAAKTVSGRPLRTKKGIEIDTN